MIAPQELIERITAAADYDDCIVIVESKTQANLRWASSTVTTNGVIAEQTVTVISPPQILHVISLFLHVSDQFLGVV